MLGAILLGILAGFLGRLLMPGSDKMGFFSTVLLALIRAYRHHESRQRFGT